MVDNPSNLSLMLFNAGNGLQQLYHGMISYKCHHDNMIKVNYCKEWQSWHKLRLALPNAWCVNGNAKIFLISKFIGTFCGKEWTMM